MLYKKKFEGFYFGKKPNNLPGDGEPSPLKSTQSAD